jgi:outer membrane protein OmpA-like peptidoglycan-associated protein
MRIKQQAFSRLMTLAFALVLMSATQALGQDTSSASQPQDAGNTPTTRSVPAGQQMTITGIVVKRGGDDFTLRDVSNVDTVVALTPQTSVKTFKKGLLRGSTTYSVTYILRGLRLQAKGTGDAQGQLAATSIQFNEQDLRTAQALQQTDQLAQENQQRIAAEEENARKLAGQIAENAALTEKAQAQADAAMASATRANNRINGLDDYDEVRTYAVLFRPGSSFLSRKAKADMDAGAAWAKTQNTKGWVVAVVGFADTTGNTARNRSLSERRANAVIGYLVMKHNLPLQRLVQPFGYGDSKPVAANNTAEGRAQNRRVEIKLLVNKGIAGTTD